MEKKGTFTNEKLSKKFVSQFDLVNYAIRLAENMIKTGRDPRVRTDSQNRSLQILAEIAQDKDQFDEIPEQDGGIEERTQRFSQHSEDRSSNFSTHKQSERRKGRKLFDE